MEILFREVRKQLKGKIDMSVVEAPFFSRGLFNRIRNIFHARSHQGDINHITGDINYISFLLNKRKTILTIHDLGFLKRIHWFKRLILQWIWIIFPVRKSAIITVISETTRQDLLSYVKCPPAKIRVIPNFIPQHFQYAPKKFNAAKPVLLQIGTKANKNLPRLLEAIKGISCRLEIVGTLSPAQIQLLEDYGIEYHAGSRLSDEELHQRYLECDMVTFVSTLEGFGLPIIEAQSVGRPVLSSNISSMPEVAGDGACLVDPYSVEAIREGVLQIIQNPEYRNALIQKGLENKKRFDPQTIAKKYLDVYRELTEQPQ